MKYCNLWIRHVGKISAFIFLQYFLFTGDVWGSGYAVYTQGASALAQGNAVAAHLDDPAAIFFNPALIGRLPGTQVQVGTTLIHASREFGSDLNSNNLEEETNHFPGTLYVTHRFNSKFSAGLGIFSPFGLGSEWGEIGRGGTLPPTLT